MAGAAMEVVLYLGGGIVALGVTTILTVGSAAITKEIWDESFGKVKDKVDVNQVGVLANQIENLQKNIKELKSDSDSIGVTVRLIQEELKKETKPSYIVEFLQNDKTIYVAKVALVGAIGYGVWKWMGYSVSDIRNGTKRCVVGALSGTTKNLAKKSGEVGEKMITLSEQLENCGKLDEPKEMSNPKKVIEVNRNTSYNSNVVDLNTKLYDLIPLEGTSCKLYRMDEQDIVAEAIWVTDDPATQVHGCELGLNASKVWVTNVVEPNAKVWRPAFGIQIMEEATKSFIAWPSDHIIYDVDYDKEAKGDVMENLD